LSDNNCTKEKDFAVFRLLKNIGGDVKMNCEYCEKHFVDSLDGLAVYCFHRILHGEIQ